MPKTFSVISFLCGVLFGALAMIPIRVSGTSGQFAHAINIEGSIPEVPPLGHNRLDRLVVENTPQALDGLSCSGCRFINAALSYGGGSFRLQDASFEGTTTLTLTGAAANTVAMLSALVSLGKLCVGR